MSAIIGIDPGSSSGAWAAISENGLYIDCGDIQSIDGRVDVFYLFDKLSEIGKAHSGLRIAVESVGVRPGQGIASSGKFMRAAGSIEAVGALAGDSLTLVRPQVWKKHHGLIGTDKKASLELARRVWPDAQLRLAKHHGRADALLIALWLKYNKPS